MSQENVEIVRRAYQSLARGDWDALFRDAHPDFVLESQHWGSFRGREAAQEFAEDQIGAFEASTMEPEAFFEGDDQVVVFVKLRARPRGSGASSAEIEVKIGHVWTLRDGAVLMLRTFPKRGEALEAAGLSE